MKIIGLRNSFLILIVFLEFVSGGVNAAPKGELPALKIVNVETAGNDNKFQASYSLNYYERTIKVEVAPPKLNEAISTFAYKLDRKSLFVDSSSNWILSPNSSFKFKDLISGNYAISVKYITKSGKESKVTCFDVIVKRPWWRTWWFWGASFVSLFGLFYGRERFLKFWADEEQRHHRQIVELELRTLQLQMNPHFIFNALNSIQSYVMTHDALTANNYLSKFAHLIRMFLDSSRSKYISLQEEVRMLNLYVEMEKLRFEGKFEYTIEVSPEVNKYFEIPTMILQPFVENSINHGLRYKSEMGFMKITFFVENNYLICRLEDNGVGRAVAKEVQSNTRKGYKSQGLKITSERLETYNKINDTNIVFSIKDLYSKNDTSEKDIGTVVEVRFPIT